MVRITRIDEDETSVTFRIEGRLVGRWIDALDHGCEQDPGDPRSVNLDLSGVTFADEQGLETLSAVEWGPVGSITCSLFVRELLSRMRSGTDV